MLQPAQAGRVERAQVLVERVDERAVRQFALELGRAAGQHQRLRGGRVLAQGAQQPRLADPRLADDRDDPRHTRLQLVQRLSQPGQLTFSPDHLGDPLISHRFLPGNRRIVAPS